VDAPSSLVNHTPFATLLEQAGGIDPVNKAILSIDEMTQQNAVPAEETISAVQSMEEQVEQLVQRTSARGKLIT
jgi:methyl-accepting chemotaxis protein